MKILYILVASTLQMLFFDDLPRNEQCVEASKTQNYLLKQGRKNVENTAFDG